MARKNGPPPVEPNTLPLDRLGEDSLSGTRDDRDEVSQKKRGDGLRRFVRFVGSEFPGVAAADANRIAATMAAGTADFLYVLERSGCVPFAELAKLTAADVDPDKGTATIRKHKNRKKVGKPRTIYLVSEVVEKLRPLVSKYPSGPLLRNSRAGAITSAATLRNFDRLRKRGGPEAAPYDYRHTYITEALIRGVPVEVVAELVGNSPAVIHRHYAHIGKDASALRAAAAKAVGGAPSA